MNQQTTQRAVYSPTALGMPPCTPVMILAAPTPTPAEGAPVSHAIPRAHAQMHCLVAHGTPHQISASMSAPLVEEQLAHPV